MQIRQAKATARAVPRRMERLEQKCASEMQTVQKHAVTVFRQTMKMSLRLLVGTGNVLDQSWNLIISRLIKSIIFIYIIYIILYFIFINTNKASEFINERELKKELINKEIKKNQNKLDCYYKCEERTFFSFYSNENRIPEYGRDWIKNKETSRASIEMPCIINGAISTFTWGEDVLIES